MSGTSLVAAVLSLSLALPASAAGIQSEIGSLEAKGKSGDLNPAERRRLAELHFLTSQCEEIKDNLPLVCACGGACPESGELTRLMKFRKLVEGGAPWDSSPVQTLWRSLRNLPEAKYWAVKALRRSASLSGPGGETEATLLRELEQQLAAMEVGK